MYTYEAFETIEQFSLLRPIFISLLIFSVILSISIILSKRFTKFLNVFSVISISVMAIIISSQLLFYSAIIVDEINLDGDSISFGLYIGILSLSVLNPLLYTILSNKDTG